MLRRIWKKNTHYFKVRFGDQINAVWFFFSKCVSCNSTIEYPFLQNCTWKRRFEPGEGVNTFSAAVPQPLRRVWPRGSGRPGGAPSWLLRRFTLSLRANPAHRSAVFLSCGRDWYILVLVYLEFFICIESFENNNLQATTYFLWFLWTNGLCY